MRTEIAGVKYHRSDLRYGSDLTEAEWAVQRYFYAWREDGTWQRINHDLLLRASLANGREASPSAGIIDSYTNLRA
jgi:transposase